MERIGLPIRVSFGIAISVGLYLLVLSTSNSELNNFISLVISSTGGFVAILLFYYLLRKELSLNILFLALFCYFFRLTIGVSHYLYFFDPAYFFLNFSDFSYLAEYIWLFESLEAYSAGLSGEMDQTVLDAYESTSKNYEMLFFMSLLFYFGGTKALTIATFNSLITTFSAFLLYFLSLKINQSRVNAYFCFFIVAIQPFEIITSIMARDNFGQFLIIYSIFLIIYFFDKSFLKLVFVLVSSYLSSLVREVYFFIPLIVGGAGNFIYSLLYSYRRFKKSNIIILVALILVATAGSSFLVDTFLSRFLDKDFFSLLLSLPISFIYSLLGPFPWTQVFLKVPGWEFHIPQYLTSVYNLSIYTGLLLYLLNRKLTRLQFVILIFFVLYFVAGILVYGGKHTVYYSLAVPLLALMDKDSSIILFFQRFFIIFVGFLILNFIYSM